MSAAAYVAVMCLAWIALLACVVAIFYAQRWIDQAIEDEMDAIAPAPCGPSRGEQRET